jgi:hypothetical protein
VLNRAGVISINSAQMCHLVQWESAFDHALDRFGDSTLRYKMLIIADFVARMEGAGWQCGQMFRMSKSKGRILDEILDCKHACRGAAFRCAGWEMVA